MTESVRVDPGAMVLTRIPWAPKATAQDRVSDSSAALAAGEQRCGFPAYSGGCAGHQHPLALQAHDMLPWSTFVNQASTRSATDQIAVRPPSAAKTAPVM